MPDYNEYIGKTVLVGISVYSHDKELLDRYQYFGKIVSIDKSICIKTDEGEIKTLPPDVNSLTKAEKGIYTLKSNGKQIENPDFVTSWSITKPRHEK